MGTENTGRSELSQEQQRKLEITYEHEMKMTRLRHEYELARLKREHHGWTGIQIKQEIAKAAAEKIVEKYDVILKNS